MSFVSENSPYYKTIIKKNKIDITTCTPEDFPILTKADLLAHFDEIVTDREISKEKLQAFLETSKKPNDLFLNKYCVIHTSGSSGTVSYYVYSLNELIRGTIPATRAYGLKLFQKIAYVAATQGHFAGVTMVSAAKRLPLLYQDVKFFDINSPFEEIINNINKMQPTSISGYAFALRKLAEAQNQKKLSVHPSVLQSGGEPLSPQDKEYIQKAFQAPVVNIYASSEHLLMGIGRDSFSGMYLMEDNLIFELEPTYTCVTNLYNYTLPLIRYQMSDRLEMIQDTTHVMPFTKVKEIVGRNEHVPVFINDNGVEDFISPIVIVEFYVKNVNKFQLHIIDKCSFVFKVCLEPHLSKKDESEALKKVEIELKNLLKEKLMTNVKFTIDVVDQLWADKKTGKFKLIVASK